MPYDHRFVEAVSLLPMLHVPADRRTVVLCIGPFAEMMAADVLRWRDVERVHVEEPPAALRDRRVTVGERPAVGTCHAVLVSPDVDPEPWLYTLAPDGVACASTGYTDRAPAFYKRMRSLFPAVRGLEGTRSPVKPWREYLPAPLFGVLASPLGAPQRKREPPKGTRRLHAKYLPCLFLFGLDEVPLVQGQTSDALEPRSEAAWPTS